MADVQIEKGYTRIAHEILENLALIKLSPTQFRIILVVWRYTYGFNRKEHKLSLVFLSEATGCERRNIQRELKSLADKKIIFQSIKNGTSRVIKFNKNYEEWVGKTAIGGLTIGETTNGEINEGRVGETDEGTIGESNEATIGETTNQDIYKDNSIDNSKDIHHEDSINPITEYEKFFTFPSAILKQQFDYWIDESNFRDPKAIICESIKRAAKEQPRQPANYVESIIKTLHDRGLFTIEAVQEYNAKFDEQKAGKSKGMTWEEATARPVEFFKNDEPLTEKEKQETKELEKELPY